MTKFNVLNEEAQKFPMRLQFFAEEGGSDDTIEEESKEDDTSTEPDTKEEVKTFTQKELNAKFKAEKESGKRSILKQLGLKDGEDVKEYLKWKESQKTDQEKATEREIAAQNAVKEAEKRAAQAEAKVTALSHGVSKEALNEVITLALSKVTEEKDVNAVLEEMSKNPIYASFFTQGAASTGTGRGSNVGSTRKGGSGTASLGARLASANKANTEKKHSYFSH